MTTPRLGSILLEWSTVLASDLDAALADQAKLTPHKRLGEILVERGVVAPEDVQRALGRQWRLPFMEKIPPLWPDRALVTQFPLEFLKKHSLIPLQTPRGNHVVAVSDPLEVFAYDAVANRLPQGASRVLCVPAAIDDALGRCFYREGEAPDEAALDDLGSDRDLSFLSGSGETEDLLDVANRPPIIRLVNSILFQAVEARTSRPAPAIRP